LKDKFSIVTGLVRTRLVTSQGKTKNTAPIKNSGGVFGFSLTFNSLVFNFLILILSSFLTTQTVQAATEANKVITNQATVSYQFLGQGNVVSDTEEFITARDSDGSGTPSVITLMHNSIDFSGQYQAAQAGSSLTASNLTVQSSSVASNSNKARASTAVTSNTGTTASSEGVSITGAFPVQPGQCATDSSGNNLEAQPTPVNYQNKELTLPGTLDLASDEFFKVGDTIFIHLQDLDQNQDPTVAEKIVVTILGEDAADQETIQLTETENSSGLFTGYVQSVDVNTQGSTPYDCKLSVPNNGKMAAQYQDKFDSIDVAAAGALFDPSSYVVNADTGLYVNDIEVTLIDTSTDLPAEVLSTDGGIFPNPVTTGSLVTDNQGNTLQFPFGGFEFPVVEGNGKQYRIEIGENTYHTYPIPETKLISDIQALPNGPYNLDEQGSRGLAFEVPGISIRMDVPLDPKDNSVLLTKTANKTQAGVGELVRYSIQLSNGEIPGIDVEVHDQLPQGIRYVAGSATIDGGSINDPSITDDGQHLTFDFADIEVDEDFTIRYVARIGISTPVGQATNSAWIEDDDSDGLGKLESNITKAHVEITEDLFSEKSRLFGRVYIGDCEGNVEQEGLSGIRIYLENGTYVVTDDDGMWHLEAQDPGTHVVQLDTDTLPKYLNLMACDDNATHAGREYSQFVDVTPGSMWRADFVVKLKPPSQGEVIQHLSSKVMELSEKEINDLKKQQLSTPVKQKLVYQLDLTGTEVILQGLRSLIMLPEGVRYKEGSVLFDGVPIKEPKKYDEQTLLFTLNDPGKDWQHVLEFEAWISEDAKPGELMTRSVPMFNAPSQNNQRTPVAFTSANLAVIPENKQAHKPKEAPKFTSFSENLSDSDKKGLDAVIKNLVGLKDLKLEVAGHTDNVLIAHRSRHIFENNQALSMARARSAANYITTQLQLKPEQVTIAGYGAMQPLLKNNSSENRAANRRVEVNILSGTNGMQMAQANSGDHMTTTMGLAPGGFDFPAAATASGAVYEEKRMPEFDKAFLAQTNNKLEWLWPTGDFLPNIPSTKIAIKHAMGKNVQLTLNKSPVSQLNFAGRETYATNKSAVSIWTGVDLKEGSNYFVASVIDESDNIVERIELTLHYSGSPTQVEFIKGETNAIADGINAPVIAVRLQDRDGYNVRNGLQGEFTVDAPYVALDPNKDKVQINRSDYKPNYEISNEGIAYITLEPTTQAGEAVIRFPLANGQEEEIRVWLKPQNREWMLIALGEGTIGYNDISGHVDNANSHDVDDEFYTDGRLALFAKGQIAGEWLVTAAYDSAKGETTPFEKLLDPNKYYTLYGDNSQQKLDASMEGKLYVRVEKERFYTVFGDYSTDLSKTELSTYLRKFHGIQSVFQGDTVSFSAFVTESAQGFQRDEIQGDGTSGLYHLSQENIISNSETITIQVRDRLRSEVIIQETELTKDNDYSIDYVDGSLFFKTPIHSTDDKFNPTYIIVRYETESDNSNDITYGGRAAVHLLDKDLEVGTTVISEELGEDSKTLTGLDARIQLSDALELKAETAQSEQVTNGNTVTANAHLLSLDYRGEQLQTKAYVRKEEAGFGLEQLNEGQSNTEKLGVETTYYFTAQQYVNTLFSDQNTLNSSARQTLLEAKLNQEYEGGRFHVGTRVNETISATNDTTSTQQLLAGHSFSVLNGQLVFNTDAEVNIKAQEDTYDLMRLGADYRLNDKVTLYSIFETGFESGAPQRTVMGLRATPWPGMQVSNSVEEQQSKDGSRMFAVHGLNQEVNLDENWSVSFGFDQAQDLENSIVDENNVAASQDDFYAMSTGWGYRSPTWQWTNRLEYRESSNNYKWNALSGLFRPVSEGLAMGINGEYRLDKASDSETTFYQVEFDIGLRPLDNGIAWLNQSKYIEEQQTSTDSDLISRRLLNNTHINKRFNKTQLSAQYGLKYVDETIDSVAYNGVIDLIGTQIRHHMAPKWDWGLHAQRLYDWELKDSRHSAGASLGYIPRPNTWVSMGYNFYGFSDSDFDGAGYSAHGIYLKLRIKADQDSLREMKAYFQ
jgi:uncharacterized repeat protein (TIGR01451 family)